MARSRQVMVSGIARSTARMPSVRRKIHFLEKADVTLRHGGNYRADGGLVENRRPTKKGPA